MVKVSVVVPVYNVEKYLKRCIDSIINQTIDNLQIILVNDGSTDRSPRICREYVELDDRVELINQENQGLSSARNTGINHAIGEYLIFVDSDDYIELDLIEVAVRTIEVKKSDMVVWGYYAEYVDDTNKNINTVLFNTKKGFLKPSNFQLNSQLINLIGYAWNKLYKTEILHKENYKFIENLSLVEDMIFNTTMIEKYQSVYFLNRPLIHYVQYNTETLGSRLYSDHFYLKEKAMKLVTKMSISLGYDKRIIEKEINQILFNSLKEIFKLLANNEEMTCQDKRMYLSKLDQNSTVKEVIKNTKNLNVKDYIIKFLFFNKMYTILLKIYSIKS